ncbi:agglutinin biogenesis protein MshP [Pseudoduganella sp. FT25W]|uniref:Agglutinin biogenesis protein MshP n=1 Tax=Duganella alba TaxID=2666081 RepID=A0A6L5QQP0_9BURK|nr:agglutinin biogenesis protein MshP [Duganella alba]MRX11678.1 agglutinin biogenesis protein MshP [Duganella alba]MRX20007.1 agglutinin biogenesis protein MshP [Duganella alba]
MSRFAFPRRKSAGVAIVTAIFLLVVVAGLAVAMVSLTTTQEDASAKDLQGVRAYQAARAGVEWALYKGLQSGLTPPQPSTSLGCGPPINVALPKDNTLSSFTVTVVVTCDPAVNGIAGGTNDSTAYHVLITSVACNQPGTDGNCPNVAPGPDYVQRRVTAQL